MDEGKGISEEKYEKISANIGRLSTALAVVVQSLEHNRFIDDNTIYKLEKLFGEIEKDLIDIV